jgi:hypothetical protein
MRKLPLLILGLIWAYLVYGLLQSFGYEKSTGYPPRSESIETAIIAALPMLLGSLIAGKREGLLKYLSWFCAVCLSIEAGYLMIFTWLDLFGFVPLLGVGTILWPYLKQLGIPNQETRVKFHAGHHILLVVIAGAGLLYWWHYNPLPSDEAMIAHFNKHRTEIEELMNRYRFEGPTAGYPIWGDSPADKTLLKQAQVKNVLGMTPIWPPNPYSHEVVKQFEESRKGGKLPSLLPYFTIYIGLIDIESPDNHTARVLTSSGPRSIFKRLVFIPETARIENGSLWLPTNPVTGASPKARVFTSLNAYPSNWDKGECVYRQIEAHWFLCLCASAV